MALLRGTNMPSLFRRAVLLACAAMMSGGGHPPRRCRCDAFSSGLRPIPSPYPFVGTSGRHSSSGQPSPTSPRHRRHRHRVSASERADGVVDVDDRTRPNIERIATHDDYLDFLKCDDRVCVISEFLHLLSRARNTPIPALFSVGVRIQILTPLLFAPRTRSTSTSHQSITPIGASRARNSAPSSDTSRTTAGISSTSTATLSVVAMCASRRSNTPRAPAFVGPSRSTSYRPSTCTLPDAVRSST